MNNSTEMPIVLASGSPRRRQLLEALGVPFEVHPPCIDESSVKFTTPEAFALGLALKKAETAAGDYPDDPRIVLAADTIVVLDNRILGKPESPGEAAEMLESLNGRCHRVITGVAAAMTEPRSVHLDKCITYVHFRTLSGDEIAEYIESGEPFDKAGAYGIQGRASRFVERVDGDYFNVVGLPLDLTLGLMEMYVDVRAWRSRLPHILKSSFNYVSG